MGKKKGGKRLGKKQVTELLQNLFQHHPNETFSFKQISPSIRWRKWHGMTSSRK